MGKRGPLYIVYECARTIWQCLPPPCAKRCHGCLLAPSSSQRPPTPSLASNASGGVRILCQRPPPPLPRLKREWGFVSLPTATRSLPHFKSERGDLFSLTTLTRPLPRLAGGPYSRTTPTVTPPSPQTRAGESVFSANAHRHPSLAFDASGGSVFSDDAHCHPSLASNVSGGSVFSNNAHRHPSGVCLP